MSPYLGSYSMYQGVSINFADFGENMVEKRFRQNMDIPVTFHTHCLSQLVVYAVWYDPSPTRYPELILT